MAKVLSDITLNDKAFFNDFAKVTIDNSLHGINSFLNALSIEFSNKISGEGAIMEQANKVESYNDIKKTTYYNIKTLHEMMSGIVTNDSGANLDNYISNPNSINKIRIDSVDEMKLFSTSTPDCDTPGSSNSFYDIYNIFQVVDRGNNDIGTKVLANLATLYKNLYADFTKESITPSDPNNQNTQVDVLTKSSINNLFSSLASESGFLYQQIPNYLNVNGSLPNKHNDETLFEIVDHMFGTHTDTGLFGDTFNAERDVKFGGPTGLPGCIFQLGTLSSSPDEDKNQKNNYTNSFCLDLNLDSNSEVSVNSEDAPDDILKSNVTAFVVDFGKQNQQMFKSIQLDTAQFYDTEESIKTWVNLVNDTGTGLQTTNLFPILEKRSYTCNVVSLGNATIQPLSYFYLRNVPLFHGTYWITNVTHKLSPNTMVTEFKGVRQPIATKADTRKALLRLIKEKIKDIENANKEASKVQTEGLPDTQGTIKFLSGSNKPYRDFIQQVKEGTGYAQMDGKDILGAYIYSVTRDNKMTAANYGVISYLYNIASIYKDSIDPSEILPAMVQVAISNMKGAAEGGDARFTDSNTLSLSYLLKNTGANFLQNDEMGQYLDNLTELSYLQKNHKLPANTKAWDIQASGSGGSFDKSGVETTLKSTNTITGFSPDGVDISGANLFLDPQEKNGSNDKYRATNNTQTLYDIFHAYDPTNFIINKINTEVTIEQVPDDKVTDLAAKKPRKYEDVNKEAPFMDWFKFFYNDNFGGDVDDTTMNQLVKFALVDSDGTFNDDKLATYLFGAGNDSNSERFIKIRNKVKEAKKGNNYQVAIFSGIKMYKTVQDIEWEGAVGDDVGLSFNGSKHWYDFDATTDAGSKENFQKFVNNDVKSFYSTVNEEYEKENKEVTKSTAEPIKVKYLGAYGYGTGDTTDNVAFFKFLNKIILSSESKKKIDLETSTSADVLTTQSGGSGAGEKRATLLGNMKRVAEAEQAKWRDSSGTLRKETDESVQTYLNSYWEAVGTTLEKKGGNQVAWSAAFISYVVKNSGASEFPYSAMHATYIVKSRDNKNSGGTYPWYGYDALTKEATVDVGDIVCYSNGGGINTKWEDFKSDTHCHCDVVVSIDEQKKARTIGGNVSQTVGGDSLQLNDDYTIDIDQSTGGGKKIYRGVLKYQPTEDSTTTTTTTRTGNVLPFTGDLTELAKAAGYDPNSPEAIMASAIAKNEGWTNKKALAYKNNNPGNLDYSDEFKKYDQSVYKQNGNTKQTSRFAVFAKAEYGFKALIESKIKSWADGRMPVTSTNSGNYESQIGKWSKNQPPTFLQFFYTYAPPTDSNDPDQYAANVVATINSKANKSFTVQSKVKDIFA
mgnify:CR=1 FL=1